MVIIVSSMNNNEFWFLLMNDLRTCGTASERHITVDAFRIRPGPKCSRRSCQAKRWTVARLTLDSQVVRTRCYKAYAHGHS